MKSRCKMQLVEVAHVHWSPQARLLKFLAFYDESIPEDQRFSKTTPSAELKMTVDNPAALEHLTLGAFFYVDFTPVAPK